MDSRTSERLGDIVDVEKELTAALQGITAAAFRKNRLLQRVAERLLEIAGEAATHVPDEVASKVDVDWRGLRAMRVLLAHAYHRVDPDQLWRAATVDLPKLAEAVRDFLE